MKPPWMRPENPKKPKYRMYADNTGELAAYNIDRANTKGDGTRLQEWETR